MRTVSPIVVTKSRNPVTVFVTKFVFPVEVAIFFNHSSWTFADAVDGVSTTRSWSLVVAWSLLSTKEEWSCQTSLWRLALMSTFDLNI